MARPQVLVDTIRSLAPQPSLVLGGAPPSPPVSVVLESGASARLDPARPQSTTWRRVLESRRRASQAVYLEIDPTTGFVTDLLLPSPVHVVAARAAKTAGDVEVEYRISQARHFLRRTHSHFQEFLAALQQAQSASSPVLVTETLTGREIIDVRPVPSGVVVPSAPQQAPRGPAPKAPPSVGLSRAKELFDLVNGLSCDPLAASAPCIPFLYPVDGCAARAHEMCRIMNEQGALPQKVWTFDYPELVTANVPGCCQNWIRHVAPMLLVDAGSGARPYAIDPAIFSEPVPVETWAGVLSVAVEGLSILDASVYWTDGKGEFLEDPPPDYALTKHSLQDSREYLMLQAASADGPPPYAACKPDAYLRDNLQDTGAEPLVGGVLSLSPDIHHFAQSLPDPFATLGTAAAKSRDDLFEPIEFGQPNYLYLRLQNRGSAAAPVDVDLYYALPSTLPTPSSWTLIGSLATPPVAPRELKVVGPIVWDHVPQPGHYCFIAVIGNALDPKPSFASIHTVQDFCALLREHNNVTWKNFDVQDVVPGSVGEISFAIQGWPRIKYRAALELDASALPNGCEVHLKVMSRLAKEARLEGLARTDEKGEKVILEASTGGIATMGNIRLRPSDHSVATLAISFPAEMPSGAYQVSVSQKIESKETGRVTRRFVVGDFPYVGNPMTDEVHLADCEWAQKMSRRNRLAFRDAKTAIQRGYNGCRYCLPELDKG